MILYLRRAIIEVLCLASLCTVIIVPAVLAQRKPEAQQVTSSLPIKWSGQPGVNRYRLQVARDENFNDIVFDRAVVGREYVVTGLPQGKYYWRVAPAPDETGTFSKPLPVEVSPTPPETPLAAVIRPPADVGWRAATGEVPRPVPARLRAGRNYDLVGVNTDGTVYALDGVSGEAMWTTRFRPGARRGEALERGRGTSFTPLIIAAPQGGSNVVVAFEGGIRALKGDTGSELWRTNLAGPAMSGVAADMEGDEKVEAVVVAGNPSTLYVIDGAAGRIISQTKLPGNVIGNPFPYESADARGVALSLQDGQVDVRRADGSSARSQKFDTPITTPPLVVASGRGPLMLVGTERGLLALNALDLRPLGRIVTENDIPRGTLTAVDIDGDGAVEIAMVTKRGRIAVVNTNDGKIRWTAEGATDADSAAFADVNGDGMLDVLVAAGASFALGFSGRDGSLIWRADEEGKSAPASDAAGTLRSLAIAPLGGGAAFVAGSDPARTSLRAVGLPKGSVKIAAVLTGSEATSSNK